MLLALMMESFELMTLVVDNLCLCPSGQISQLVVEACRGSAEPFVIEFGVPIAIAQRRMFGVTDKLLMEFPERLCLVSI